MSTTIQDKVNQLLQLTSEIADAVRRLRDDNNQLKSGNRKRLSKRDVAEIRHLYQIKAFTQAQLAGIFDVNRSSISRIVRGLAY